MGATARMEFSGEAMKQTTPIFLFSHAEGFYVGMSLEGASFSLRDEENFGYYEKQLKAQVAELEKRVADGKADDGAGLTLMRSCDAHAEVYNVPSKSDREINLVCIGESVWT